MFRVLEVNGLATLASVSDRDIPAWAALRALRMEKWEREGRDVSEGEEGGETGFFSVTVMFTYSTIISSISTHDHTITTCGERKR